MDRRQFLRNVGVAGAAAASSLRWAQAAESDAKKPPKVAVVLTAFTYRSHAHVLLENFLEPYLFNGEVTSPGVEVVSLYVDQFPEGEMARQVAKDYRLPIFPTIAEAMGVGADRLAVDAMLAIGEHGSYPTNDKGQVEYPRKRFFDEIAKVCERHGRGVPVFNDKHLSYRWDWAKEMVDTARRLKMSLMAGSSVPLAERRPPLALPADKKIIDAVSIHGGGVESYDFHAFEVLQSLIESRPGGETGVKRVQFLAGEPLWKAADEGQWSIELAQAAMATEVGPDHDFTRAIANRGITPKGNAVGMHGILLTYVDGLRAIVLKVGDNATRWNFACRVEGEDAPRATHFYVGPWENRNLFKALAHAIQTHFRQGEPPYPVERTLLTTGIVAAEMDSRHDGGKSLDTPHLQFAYAPRDFSAMREMGATWKIITEDTPQPMGMHSAAR